MSPKNAIEHTHYTNPKSRETPPPPPPHPPTHTHRATDPWVAVEDRQHLVNRRPRVAAQARVVAELQHDPFHPLYPAKLLAARWHLARSGGGGNGGVRKRYADM